MTDLVSWVLMVSAVVSAIIAYLSYRGVKERIDIRPYLDAFYEIGQMPGGNWVTALLTRAICRWV